MSSSLTSFLPSIPPNKIFVVLQILCFTSPFTLAPGTKSSTMASNLSLSSFMYAVSFARPFFLSSAAFPSPAIPGRFSVPGLKPSS